MYGEHHHARERLPPHFVPATTVSRPRTVRVGSLGGRAESDFSPKDSQVQVGKLFGYIWREIGHPGENIPVDGGTDLSLSCTCSTFDFDMAMWGEKERVREVCFRPRPCFQDKTTCNKHVVLPCAMWESRKNAIETFRIVFLLFMSCLILKIKVTSRLARSRVAPWRRQASPLHLLRTTILTDASSVNLPIKIQLIILKSPSQFFSSPILAPIFASRHVTSADEPLIISEALRQNFATQWLAPWSRLRPQHLALCLPSLGSSLSTTPVWATQTRLLTIRLSTTPLSPP